MADLSPRLWRPAHVTDIIVESPRTKTFRLAVEGDCPFIAGQHCSIQLRAPNGYTTARDYSFSSAPSSGNIDITIARVPHGEMSGWFNDTAKIGDGFDISPAVGHYFNWTPDQTEPVLLIAGGVGVTPLMGMLREHRDRRSTNLMTMLYSVRDRENVCFKSELTDATDVAFTLTGEAPKDWHGNSGRITAAMLRPLLKTDQTIYLSGSTRFVEAIDQILATELSIDPARVRAERFG